MKLLDSTLYEQERELERESVSRGIDRYRRLVASATKRGDGASLQPAERLVAAWFPALDALIENEQRECANGIPGKGRAVYGGWLAKLAPDKCAAITLSVILGRCLCEVNGVPVAQLTMGISGAIMAEWNYERIKMMKGDTLRDLLHTSKCRFKPNRINATAAKHIACGECERRETCLFALDPARWPLNVRGHLGAIMLNFTLAVAQVPGDKGQPFPAFDYFMQCTRKGHRTVGTVRLSHQARERIDAGHMARQFLRPKYQPMLVQPGTWTAVDRGGYIELPISLIKRTRHGEIPHVIHRAVNCLNATPWRINKCILDVVEKLWETGGNIAELPPRNRLLKPPIPADFDTNLESKKAWKNAASATYRRNAQDESERVIWVMKLDIAQRMAKYERFYFPHQLDFRGRAYSVPLFLNHQGDDVCRGLMEFTNPVNPNGMGEYWLQIHLANSCGIDKVGFGDRVKWVQQNEDRFKRWRSDPLTYMDWTEVDKPFQALAAAYALDDSEAAKHLPVQLDGSNNALQHYAAMLRDEETAALVNLIQADSPQDFYSDVAHWAAKITGEDAEKGVPIAKALEGWVDRSLVKQTAMTVFYNVTMIGARRQLRQHLNDAGFQGDMQYHASKYLAGIVLKAVSTSCPPAHQAMRWLSKCAELIAQSGEQVTWITPLGLAVTQPYKRTAEVKVTTIMQDLYLRRGSEDLPVLKRKQVQGFPPNYVHSLDAAHLMNTAVRCAEAGIDFAGVHDCYWSHAGNIPVLNAIIREEFVKLHQTSQLHALHDQFRSRYASLSFPEPPAVGNLDLRNVNLSDYAFA